MVNLYTFLMFIWTPVCLTFVEGSCSWMRGEPGHQQNPLGGLRMARWCLTHDPVNEGDKEDLKENAVLPNTRPHFKILWYRAIKYHAALKVLFELADKMYNLGRYSGHPACSSSRALSILFRSILQKILLGIKRSVIPRQLSCIKDFPPDWWYGRLVAWA